MQPRLKAVDPEIPGGTSRRRLRFRGLCASPLKTTAFSRGYTLSPLRGSGKILSKKRNYSAFFEALWLNTKTQRHKGTEKAGIR